MAKERISINLVGSSGTVGPASVSKKRKLKTTKSKSRKSTKAGKIMSRTKARGSR
jgi:hypothetical protein|tara:strand:- start:3847 stop:4011 length:165 start_codon:yes stop_codon:yes gene_type:complete